MSRLPATTTALNMTATMAVDASVVSHPKPSRQNLPSFHSHNLPAHPSHSTTIPQDTIESNQTNDDQLGVKHGHKGAVKKKLHLCWAFGGQKWQRNRRRQKQSDWWWAIRDYKWPQNRCKQTSITIHSIRAAKTLARFSTFYSLLFFIWLQAGSWTPETNQRKVSRYYPSKKVQAAKTARIALG